MATVRRRPVAAPTSAAPTTAAPATQVRRAATRRAAPTSATPAAPLGAGVNLTQRLTFEYVPVNDITPYEYNPRDNEKAVPVVANSIRSFGFLIPCVIDANKVLVCGHTRWAAAKLLEMDAIPCVYAEHLSQDQINAFRVIDNKVAEVADWNFDVLSGEIAKLEGLGLDFTAFGWSQSEIDCLSDVVADECLDAPVVTTEGDIAAVAQRRAPLQTRVVIGDFVFFLPTNEFRVWAESLRQACAFSDAAIVDELRRRLDMPEA